MCADSAELVSRRVVDHGSFRSDKLLNFQDRGTADLGIFLWPGWWAMDAYITLFSVPVREVFFFIQVSGSAAAGCFAIGIVAAGGRFAIAAAGRFAIGIVAAAGRFAIAAAGRFAIGIVADAGRFAIVAFAAAAVTFAFATAFRSFRAFPFGLGFPGSGFLVSDADVSLLRRRPPTAYPV